MSRVLAALLSVTIAGGCAAARLKDRPGVLAGDQYHLTRDTAYVGRITVLDVRGDKAFARADERWVGVAWPPRAGDRAWVE